MPPLVKICGITSAEDAIHATAWGADALGLNFCSESPRFLQISHARQILADYNSSLPLRLADSKDLKKPWIVAVVSNPSTDYLNELLETIDISAIQFHGEESVEFCSNYRQWKLIKALRFKNQPRTELVEWLDVVDHLLFDAYHPCLRGGSGQLIAETLLEDLRGYMSRAFLAGGLNPANVGERVKRFAPFGVDVSSGVERAPGIKDPQLVESFITQAKL